MQTINITALRHSAFYTPLLYTISGGFLQKQGLEPNYLPIQAGQSINQLLESGEFHVSQSAVAVGFSALEQKQSSNIRHFAQINQHDGFIISARKKMPDFKWCDLENSNVLIDHLFQPLATFRYALHKQGVDSDKVNIIDAGDVTAIDKAYRNGLGDFVHQQGPAPQQLEADGLAHVVCNVAEVIGPLAFSSLCANKSWLNTAMADAFKEAYQQACTQLQETPTRLIAKHIKHFFKDIDFDVLNDTIDYYKKLGCWSADTSINDAAYETLLDVFEFNGLISKRHEKTLLICD